MATKQKSTARKPTAAELKNRTPLGGTPIPPKALVPAKPKSIAVAKPAEDYVSRYLDEVAPANIVGRMIKFSKDGKFVTHDDGEEISEDQDFIALCDETLVGYVKFNGPGEQPTRAMGLLYDGFVMPERDTLGDLDKAQWEMGLDGELADPWQHHMYLVLQQADTRELFTFVTSCPTGRRAVGNLLRHYDRLRRTHADDVPVVRLRVGGFPHKDSRVGWVVTPVFVVFGKTPRDSAAKPDTSTGGVLNDQITL
jgi:hypothetical protein